MKYGKPTFDAFFVFLSRLSDAKFPLDSRFVDRSDINHNGNMANA